MWSGDRCSNRNDHSLPKVVRNPLTRKTFDFTVPFEVTGDIRNVERLAGIRQPSLESKGREWDNLA